MTGWVFNALMFPGQFYDPETALHQNGHRDYDPSTGRYIQSDPIGLAGGINTYAYVAGNPLTRVDPDGRYALWLVPLVPEAAGIVLADIVAGAALIAIAGDEVGTGLVKAAMAAKSQDDAGRVGGQVCEPGGNDPCRGLRKQLQDHQRKLREYLTNPLSMDNKGFLAYALAIGDKDLYTKIYTTRIARLQGQIANFQRMLEDCERQNGR